MMTNFWYSLKIRNKYFLTVSGSQMHLLLTQHATTTAVFKSSYCAKCVITFDNKQDLIKTKKYLNSAAHPAANKKYLPVIKI